MKQIRANMHFLKARNWKGEAVEEEFEGKRKKKGQRWEKKQIAEGRKASEEKIRRGSEDARSSSDESVCSDVSRQVVRKRKNKGNSGGR